jgi:hypothetical protein
MLRMGLETPMRYVHPLSIAYCRIAAACATTNRVIFDAFNQVQEGVISAEGGVLGHLLQKPAESA